MLLRVLAARIEERMQPVYLPVSTLPQGEICEMALGLVGRSVGCCPESDLLDFAMEQRDAGRAHRSVPFLMLLIERKAVLKARAAAARNVDAQVQRRITFCFDELANLLCGSIGKHVWLIR